MYVTQQQVFRSKHSIVKKIPKMEQPLKLPFLFILYSLFMGTMIDFSYIITALFSYWAPSSFIAYKTLCALTR